MRLSHDSTAMSSTATRIRVLPADVSAQIESSVHITSLQDVVQKLFENALDAQATEVDIVVDFAKGFCSVKDNGFGIPASEFAHDGNLGNCYCTSKFQTTQPTYGRTGRFLSCLKSISLLFITSQHTSDPTTSSIVFYKGKRISRPQNTIDVDESFRTSGTHVVVHNLFGNMPVRAKEQANRFSSRMEIETAFRGLKIAVIAHLLALPRPINVFLRIKNSDHSFSYRGSDSFQEEGKDSTTFLQRIRSIFAKCSLSHQSEARYWKFGTVQVHDFTISAALFMVAQPTKGHQFISVGLHPVDPEGNGSVFYHEINKLFQRSIFGIDEHATQCSPNRRKNGKTGRKHSKPTKGLDKWPAFYMRIDDKYNLLNINHFNLVHPAVNSTSNVQKVQKLVQSLIEQFLQTQELIPCKEVVTMQSRAKEITQSAVCTMDRDVFPSSWRRIKCSNQTTDVNILKGLPFLDDHAQHYTFDQASTVKCLSHKIVGDLQLNDSELCKSISGPADTSCQPSLSSANGCCDAGTSAEEDFVAWTDPRTGCLIKLNADNGFALPKPQSTSEDNSIIKEKQPGKHDDPNIRLCHRPSSKNEIAQRLQNYLTEPIFKEMEAEVSQLSDVKVKTVNSIAQYLQVSGGSSLGAGCLRRAKVLRQVDQKFILALVPHFTCFGLEDAKSGSYVSDALVLIDQHAADERVKVEELYAELCSGNTTSLSPSVTFDIHIEEAKRLGFLKDYFATWCIHYEVVLSPAASAGSSGNTPSIPQATIKVTSLPTLVAERCRLGPKILIELLRIEIWSNNKPKSAIKGADPLDTSSSRQFWLSRMTHCPQGLVEMLNSRACRTAIMFNDILNLDQCQSLLQRLSVCQLPFKCAHGRPSVTTVLEVRSTASRNLADIGNANIGNSKIQMDEVPSFGKAFDHWMKLTSK